MDINIFVRILTERTKHLTAPRPYAVIAAPDVCSREFQQWLGRLQIQLFDFTLIERVWVERDSSRKKNCTLKGQGLGKSVATQAGEISGGEGGALGKAENAFKRTFFLDVALELCEGKRQACDGVSVIILVISIFWWVKVFNFFVLQWLVVGAENDGYGLGRIIPGAIGQITQPSGKSKV